MKRVRKLWQVRSVRRETGRDALLTTFHTRAQAREAVKECKEWPGHMQSWKNTRVVGVEIKGTQHE